jgi:hypothetical protein
LTSFTATKTTLLKGEEVATLVSNDQDGWTAAYTYSSDNGDVVTIDTDGKITAVAKGSTTVRATLNVDNDEKYEAAFGWYFYYLCEAFHYCIESVFCFILNEIDDLKNPPMSFLIEDIKNKVLSKMDKERLYQTINDWKNNIGDGIEEMFNELKRLIEEEKDYPQAVVQSIALLLRLQLEYELNKDRIERFENRYDLTDQRGIISTGLDSYVARHSNLSIPNYIEVVVKQIMQEHTIVAIGKMGNNDTDLRKFIFEDGKVVLVERRYPTETSPRIDSLYSFLQDLNYIDSEGNLSKIAKDYIKNYGDD